MKTLNQSEMEIVSGGSFKSWVKKNVKPIQTVCGVVITAGAAMCATGVAAPVGAGLILAGTAGAVTAGEIANS